MSLEKRNIIDNLHERVDSFFPMEKVKESFNPVREHTDEFIGFFRKTFLDELLISIIENIESIQTKTINREQEKEKIEKDLISLKENKGLIEKQLKDVDQYIKELSF